MTPFGSSTGKRSIPNSTASDGNTGDMKARGLERAREDGQVSRSQGLVLSSMLVLSVLWHSPRSGRRSNVGARASL